MSTNPIVSVCMSVYNAEKYLAQAVESILDQSFTNFEFIITDDGSTDKSLEIIKFYATQDQRICFKHQKNRGISKTRNEMLRQAKGEFIAVMDADDIALPERLEKQVQFLQAHPDVVVVGGAFNLIDEKSRFLTCLYPPETDLKIQEKSLVGHVSICHPCAMIRREEMLLVGGYDESFSSALDIELFFRLGEVKKLSNLNQSVISYRVHSDSISEEKQAEQLVNLRRACKKACKRRGITRYFELKKHWRPTRDRASRYQFALKYGWWAWNSGQRRTALIYGWKAVRTMVWKKEAFQLVFCALRKPLPTAK